MEQESRGDYPDAFKWIGEIWELLRLQGRSPCSKQTGKLTKKRKQMKGEKRTKTKKHMPYRQEKLPEYNISSYYPRNEWIPHFPISLSVSLAFPSSSQLTSSSSKIPLRQVGHTAFPCFSHSSMHTLWKMCLHGAFQSDLLCLGMSRQMVHSSGFSRRLRDDCLRMHPCSYSSPQTPETMDDGRVHRTPKQKLLCIVHDDTHQNEAAIYHDKQLQMRIERGIDKTKGPNVLPEGEG